MNGTTALTLLTIAASLAALGALWTLWRVRRFERDRSEARVAALAAVLDPPSEDGRPWLAGGDARSPAHPLFTVALGFAVVTLTIIAAATIAQMRPRPAAGAAAAPAAGEPRLVLLALRYERDGADLVVRGLVRNHGTTPPTAVTAVVTALSREGRLLARSSGPLRLKSLEPHTQADFFVTMAGAAEAARYQVTFRGPDHIIRHVDLRGRTGGGLPAGGRVPASPAASRQAQSVIP